MISILHWDSATNTCRETAPAQLPKSAAEVSDEDVWWIDLCDPTLEEQDLIFGRFFPVHALTLEDIVRPRAAPDQGSHLPKAEEFPDYLFVIVNPLPSGLVDALSAQAKEARAHKVRRPSALLSRKQRPQLSAVLSRQVLITHHYQSLECVTTARTFISRHTDTARRGPDFLFHHILDAMVDEYAPILEKVGGRLDRLETRLFKDPTPTLLGRLLQLKRVITGLRKTLILEREVLARLVRGEFELVDEREVAYYRNVYDHLVRYSELVEAGREMVSDLMETHLSAVSNRLNQVMKVLTMISTIVLPMTLVAGIYGMNFRHMPELTWQYGYPMALGIMLCLAVGSLVFFRWKGWL